MRAWRTSLTVTAIASAVLLTAGTTVGVAAARPAGGTAHASVPWDRVGFDPGTRAEQWVFRTPSTAAGIVAAIPFYSRENRNL
jgi:hypothetical protein